MRKVTNETIKLKAFVFNYLLNGRVLARTADLIASHLCTGHGGRTSVERAILRETDEILAQV